MPISLRNLLPGLAMALAACGGHDSTAAYEPLAEPTLADLAGEVVDISCGSAHTCALDPQGSVSCWGARLIGIDQLLVNGEPRAIDPGFQVAQISAGQSLTCALGTEGQVACWGDGTSGQFVDGVSRVSETAVAIPGFESGVSALAVGSLHVCALQDGTVWCWGENDWGQVALELGQDNTLDSGPVDLGIQDAVGLAAGSEHACALIGDGSVVCWGSNDYGQVDPGVDLERVGITDVQLAGAAESLGLGRWHSCALLVDGTVQCWGTETHQQSAPGAETAPATVEALSDVIEISAGATHTCALTADGDVYCWGEDAFGQLGDGGDLPGTQIATPQRALGGPYLQLSAGGYHVCATDEMNQLFCWGDNAFLQAG